MGARKSGQIDRVGEYFGGREHVEDIQRARILSAMVEVAAEVGFIGASVAPVVARAGVSRRTFYELFTGREDCFLAAFDWAVTQVRRAMAEEYALRRSWRERVRHALAALLVMLDAEPELARVCVIEALGAGKLVLERRARLLDELALGLEAEAPRGRDRGQAPLLTAEGIVGGAFSVIHGRLLVCSSSVVGGQGVDIGMHDAEEANRDESSREPARATKASHQLIDLHGQLMALIVLPYLGPRAAGEELTRMAPEVARSDDARMSLDGGGGKLLERLDMRLTYRTVRCLMFIGEHPACSNREISGGAEITDEGQTSKMLSRLTRLGLIVNSQAHGPGYPNRWTLTPQGKQVLGAVRER